MPSTSLDSQILIRAGAGAGKTTAMVKHLLRILVETQQARGRFPSIVVSTFTRKATQELRERVLHEAIKIGDPALLLHVQRSPDLQISTIHGVLIQYLMQFSQDLGFPPEIQFSDAVFDLRGRRKILLELLRAGEKSSLELQSDLQATLEEMPWKQIWEFVDLFRDARASCADLVPLSLEEIQRHQLEHLNAWRARCLELLERLRAEEVSAGWQEYCKMLSAVLNAPREEFRNRLIDFNETRPSGARKSKNSNLSTMEMKDELHKFIKSKLAEDQWDPDFQSRYVERINRLHRLFTGLAEREAAAKKISGRLNMADLEEVSIQLLRAKPETAQLFGKRIDFWMLDEFQDTSPRQVALLEAFSSGRGLFVVGDPQQSIYLFRGSDLAVFHDQTRKTERAGGVVETLMKNYRSSPEVLEFINEFFKVFNSSFESMTAGRDLAKSPPLFRRVEVWPKTSEVENFDATATVQKVQELLGLGISPSAICILCSKRKFLAEVSEALSCEGIPFQWSRGDEFLERSEVNVSIQLVKVLLNPHDNLALVSLLRSPYFAHSDDELVRIGRRRPDSFWKELSTASSQVVSQISHFREHALRFGVSSAWLKAALHFKFFESASALDSTGEKEACLWRFHGMLKQAEQKSGLSILDYLQSLSEASGSEEMDLGEIIPARETRAVQLMTIHAAKGLQFDHVILPFLGRLTFNQSDKNPFLLSEALQRYSIAMFNEEGVARHVPFALEWREQRLSSEAEQADRLLYVAMTRARESLTLIWDEVQKESWAARFPDFRAAQFESLVHYRADSPSRSEGRASGSMTKSVTKSEMAENSPPTFGIQPWRDTDSPSQRRRASLGVTTLLKNEAQKEVSSSNQILQPISLVRRVQSASKGTRIHRSLEAIKYGQAWPEELSALKSWRDGLIPTLIDRGEVESGFVIHVEQTQVQGKIDLWGRDQNDVAWIIDYKTGSLDSRDEAIRQLEVYSLALRWMGRISMTERVQLLPIYLNALSECHPVEARAAELIEKFLIEKYSWMQNASTLPDFR